MTLIIGGDYDGEETDATSDIIKMPKKGIGYADEIVVYKKITFTSDTEKFVIYISQNITVDVAINKLLSKY